ncbi:MAG: ATP-binding domain-containing protein [Steroidobacteraceae bacterium]|nr:ATP-binding domain-containing protein [Steroidobacteraceae bacterium]
MSDVSFTHGANGKPVATHALEATLAAMQGLSGECFFGYPLIATPEGKYFIDATLVSPEKGVVLFDLVEGTDVGDYASRQDDLANKIEAKLRLHKELVQGRRLIPPLQVVTFVPAINDTARIKQDDYPLANEANLAEVIEGFQWEEATDDLYRMTLSSIESLSSIRKSRSKREVTKPDSRGAKLKRLEDSIATLDHRQNRAVIETVDGVQRIRGLAGSGKTIVLALKAAYLHTQHSDWRIAVTFNTRSLKGQFKRLINNFCIEQSGEEPDWTKIRIVNAWGAPGGSERDGIYYEFCRATGQEFYDFRAASHRFGGSDKAFDGACQAALRSSCSVELYDALLVDEAQDFAPSFLRLCYAMLKVPKRLVYAYDELQNLSGTSLPPPEEIFGSDNEGRPLVSLGDDRRRDVILQKCYRNSRPVLVTAHALGFGIYRERPRGAETGLVQMFDQPALWEEIGYRVRAGNLAKGEHVVLERTNETSPGFLADHSPIDDLVLFLKFANEAEQNAWLVEQIKTNLQKEELRYDDIIVIHPDPISARERLGPIRKALFDCGIQNHLAGVDTVADVFFKSETPSVTFTGIYRAKGNEAGMVYVINAQECDGTGAGLASLRNRLFTAITRSKAWVRVIGHGPGMARLIEEFNQLKRHDFTLSFAYPPDEVLAKLRIVHRDLSPHEKQRLEQKKGRAIELADALERGELTPEDLDADTKLKLLRLLGGGK